ncbi:hypothetical protein IMSHALPRED_004747 [Imshaugia aleurites]|uniref:Uncharacterized protein n=1 Tax=Imshaugia aleurites TaxID=172621 RepID=A0A8H3F8U9_9LECA|nr:hypothetical protein IMSHALPRED_004747 [Imshaugia aleurites]
MKARTLVLAALTISIPLATAYSGEMTFYTPATTPSGSACAIAAQPGEAIVAISYTRFTAANTNDDPLCGTYISIYNPANQQTYPNVKIVDKCMGCDADSIDVNVELFEALGFDSGVGRAHGMDWGGNTVGGKEKRSGELEPLVIGAGEKRGLHHPHGRVNGA